MILLRDTLLAQSFFLAFFKGRFHFLKVPERTINLRLPGLLHIDERILWRKKPVELARENKKKIMVLCFAIPGVA